MLQNDWTLAQTELIQYNSAKPFPFQLIFRNITRCELWKIPYIFFSSLRWLGKINKLNNRQPHAEVFPFMFLLFLNQLKFKSNIEQLKIKTYSWSRLCLNVSLYLSRRFLRMSIVSFSCRLFDSSAGKSKAISVITTNIHLFYSFKSFKNNRKKKFFGSNLKKGTWDIQSWPHDERKFMVVLQIFPQFFCSMLFFFLFIQSRWLAQK